MTFTTQTVSENNQSKWSSIIKRLECPVDVDATYRNDKWTSKRRINWVDALSDR
jgi:hypothetical protein